MKFKKEVSFSLFIVLLMFGSVSGQVVKTAAVPYTKGASPFTPNIASSSELRVDTAASALYWWDRDALTWMRFRPGIDVVTGSSAPAYTPRDNQSLFAVNADGELYYYNSPSWVQIGGAGGGGIYGGSGTTGEAFTAVAVDSIIRFSTTDPNGRIIANVAGGTDVAGLLIADTLAQLLYDDPGGTNLVEANNEGVSITTIASDRATITGADMRYAADYSGTYSNRSIPDKEYVDGVATTAVSITETEIAFGDVGDASITSTPELTYQTPILGVLADEAEFSAINTAASSATGGGLLTLAAFDGAALASGDRLGQVRFFGQTGVGGTTVGANIDAYTEGVWGSGDAPTGLYFFTTPDGSGTALERLKITNTGAIGIKKNSAGTTEDFVSIAAYGSESDLNFAIVPKGTGALTASISDGTATGGNARGQYAVDWQLVRTNATDVASGNYSTIPGGRRCTASGTYSFATGFRATASGAGSVCFGGSGAFSVGASATGDNSFAFGNGADATATSAIAFNADASAQNAIAFNSNATHYGEFSANGLKHLYLSELTFGTGAQELFLDGNGGTLRATIASGVAWVCEVRVLARVSSPGGGTVAARDIYAATYKCVIANKSGTTALVGTVQADMAAQFDANMATASFTIAADDTNDALTVTYNPGVLEDGTTQVSVYATIWLNEF